MLNVKKLLTQILLKLNGFSTQTIQLSSVTLAANGGTGDITGSTVRSGYTALGIVAVSKSGAGNGFASITSFYLNGNYAVISLYNHSSSSRTIGGTALVLYKKS